MLNVLSTQCYKQKQWMTMSGTAPCKSGNEMIAKLKAKNIRNKIKN